jgi:hypothetical protein
MQNKHLEKHGYSDRVDHRSLKEQGIVREPEKHLGPKFVSSMTVEQASAILERRVIERELLRENKARDSIIDLSTDVSAAIAKKIKRQISNRKCVPVLMRSKMRLKPRRRL